MEEKPENNEGELSRMAIGAVFVYLLWGKGVGGMMISTLFLH